MVWMLLFGLAEAGLLEFRLGGLLVVPLVFVGLDVFALFGELVFLLALVAQHGVADVAAADPAALGSGEADLAEHLGVLEGLADDQLELTVAEIGDSGAALVAALHELDQPVRQ